MNKYIDSDKLKKSVNRYRDNAKAAFNPIEDDADYYKGKIDACEDIQEFITSLQQEQPEVDLVEEITRFFSKNPIPHEHLTDWPLLKNTALYFYNIGRYSRHVKPEVDLEEEIDSEWAKCNPIDEGMGVEVANIHIEAFDIITRHFYELGLNTKKDKLPEIEIELDNFTNKVDTFMARYKYPESISIKGAMTFMARLFYQYPNVARQWYDNLPKTTMD